MSMWVALNLLVFIAILFGLYSFQKNERPLSHQVLLGLIIGVIFGWLLQLFYGANSPAISQSIDWINIVGNGYVKLLKMIVIPLVLVSMYAAIVKLGNNNALGKITGLTLGVLITSTVIAALIGVLVSSIFGLSAEGLVEGARETARLGVLEQRIERVSDLSVPQIILSFIPQDPFFDLTNGRSTSIIAVVIFAILLGLASRKVMQENDSLKTTILNFTDSTQAIVMRLVKMIISLTPYGVAALMTKMVSNSNADDILNLLSFILASYVAIFLMFLVHGVFVMLAGVNPVTFFKNIWPVLTFAFSSRSSAATIPLNVETQIAKLKNAPVIANLSASFGATIGQNGCAGLYPAMLAVMVAPTVGINPLEISFLLSLCAIIAISSFGIAGVGGGATFAALVVLPAMGLPIAIVALLISIEPLIDMGRTALNVSGAMTAGTVSDRILKPVGQNEKESSNESDHS